MVQYTGGKTKGSLGFNKTSLETAINHFIKNCYMTMKEAAVTRMGSDPAPFWANLFLYLCEAYRSSLISSDKIKARYFHSTKRFIIFVL